MHSSRSALLLVGLALGLTGCPSDPAAGGDAGRDAASALDAAGELDAPGAPDAFAATDAPLVPDAPVHRDAPVDRDGHATTDAWRDSCPVGLGMFCEDTAVCPSGYECMVGRCAPQGRMLCGGFAGAMCTEPGFRTCIFFSSADFGPCLTAEERRCICDDPERAAGFDCS